MTGARDGQLRTRRGADSPPWALQMFDDDLGLWLTLCQADEEEDAMRAGIPVLRGPYVVDFSAMSHDGDSLTLWTPEIGDIVLALWADYVLADNFAPGTVDVGLGIDPTHFATGVTGTDSNYIQPGTPFFVHVNTGGIQVRYQAGGLGDATAGHVAYYTLVARAVAP